MRGTVPRSSAHDTGVGAGAAIEGPRPAIIGCIPVPVVVATLNPLRHVSMHVVQPKGIRCEAADRCRLTPIPPASAIIAIGVAMSGIVSPPVTGMRARACSVLPFGLGQ